MTNLRTDKPLSESNLGPYANILGLLAHWKAEMETVGQIDEFSSLGQQHAMAEVYDRVCAKYGFLWATTLSAEQLESLATLVKLDPGRTTLQATLAAIRRGQMNAKSLLQGVAKDDVKATFQAILDQLDDLYETLEQLHIDEMFSQNPWM